MKFSGILMGFLWWFPVANEEKLNFNGCTRHAVPGIEK